MSPGRHLYSALRGGGGADTGSSLAKAAIPCPFYNTCPDAISGLNWRISLAYLMASPVVSSQVRAAWSLPLVTLYYRKPAMPKRLSRSPPPVRDEPGCKRYLLCKRPPKC